MVTVKEDAIKKKKKPPPHCDLNEHPFFILAYNYLMPLLLRKLYPAKVGISLSQKDIGFLFPLGPYGNVSVDGLQNNSDCLDMCHYNETLFSVSRCNLLVVNLNKSCDLYNSNSMYICET